MQMSKFNSLIMPDTKVKNGCLRVLDSRQYYIYVIGDQ